MTPAGWPVGRRLQLKPATCSGLHCFSLFYACVGCNCNTQCHCDGRPMVIARQKCLSLCCWLPQPPRRTLIYSYSGPHMPCPAESYALNVTPNDPGWLSACPAAEGGACLADCSDGTVGQPMSFCRQGVWSVPVGTCFNPTNATCDSGA